jgi:hypothetical protein
VALAVNAYLSVRGRRAGITEEPKVNPCDGIRDEVRALTEAMSLAHEHSRIDNRQALELAVIKILRESK